MSPKCGFLFVCVFLAGCASPVTGYRQQLDSALVVPDVSGVSRTPLLAGKTIKGSLKATDPATHFQSGKSFVDVYSVTAGPGLAAIHVVGDCECMLPDTAAWLFPQVTVMNSEGVTVAQGPDLDLRNRVKTAYWSERILLQGLVPLPPGLEGELLVVVHATDALLKKGVSLTRVSNQVTTVAGTPVPSGQNTSSVIVPSSPVGLYEITALPPGNAYPEGSKWELPPYGVILDLFPVQEP